MTTEIINKVITVYLDLCLKADDQSKYWLSKMDRIYLSGNENLEEVFDQMHEFLRENKLIGE